MKGKSNSEVGHAKNVASLEELIARCIHLGAMYNPASPELQVNGLQQLLTEARTSLDQLIDYQTRESNAVNQRRTLFKGLPSLVTRIVNALAASGANAQTLEDAKGIQRKITGKRSSKQATAETPEVEATAAEDAPAINGENGDATAAKTRSSSQQSYDQKIEHLARLVSLLQNEPASTQ